MPHHLQSSKRPTLSPPLCELEAARAEVGVCRPPPIPRHVSSSSSSSSSFHFPSRHRSTSAIAGGREREYVPLDGWGRARVRPANHLPPTTPFGRRGCQFARCTNCTKPWHFRRRSPADNGRGGIPPVSGAAEAPLPRSFALRPLRSGRIFSSPLFGALNPCRGVLRAGRRDPRSPRSARGPQRRRAGGGRPGGCTRRSDSSSPLNLRTSLSRSAFLSVRAFSSCRRRVSSPSPSSFCALSARVPAATSIWVAFSASSARSLGSFSSRWRSYRLSPPSPCSLPRQRWAWPPSLRRTAPRRPFGPC